MNMTDLDQARDKIEEILNTEEYQVYYEDTRNVIQKWWDSVVEWFQGLLSNIFSSLEPSNGFATGLVVILGVITFVLVILAVFLLVRYYKRKYRFRDPTHLYHKHERDWTYNDHLKKVSELEANGNLQAATRHLFLALLLNFHENGYVKARIWKTNWEYYEELKRLGKKRAESFYQLAQNFDGVVYGERTVEEESYVTYKEAILHWIQEPPESGIVEG